MRKHHPLFNNMQRHFATMVAELTAYLNDPTNKGSSEYDDAVKFADDVTDAWGELSRKLGNFPITTFYGNHVTFIYDALEHTVIARCYPTYNMHAMADQFDSHVASCLEEAFNGDKVIARLPDDTDKMRITYVISNQFKFGTDDMLRAYDPRTGYEHNMFYMFGTFVPGL